jgi:TolA-binding protein
MSKGGFNFGNVGGNVSIEAGGDVVAGDKTTTTITMGFKQEEDKQAFLQQIEALRQQLRELKSEIEATQGIDEDEKEAIVIAVLEQIKSLKTAKDEAEQLPAQQEPSKEKREAIETPLNAVQSVLNKATALFDKAAEIGDKVRKINSLKLIWPLLANARHLFGLP